MAAPEGLRLGWWVDLIVSQSFLCLILPAADCCVFCVLSGNASAEVTISGCSVRLFCASAVFSHLILECFNDVCCACKSKQLFLTQLVTSAFCCQLADRTAAVADGDQRSANAGFHQRQSQPRQVRCQDSRLHLQARISCLRSISIPNQNVCGQNDFVHVLIDDVQS